MSRAFLSPVVSVVLLLAFLLPFAQHSDLPFTPRAYNDWPISNRPDIASAPGWPPCFNYGTGSAGAGYSGSTCISDPMPLQHSTVTVYAACGGSVCYYIGVLPMTATWHFESGTQTCSGTQTLQSGASCSLDIGAAKPGYRVNVDVDLGALHMTTWFTPQLNCSTVTGIPANECQALVALYNSTAGAGWGANSGWVTTNTPCSWYGVACTAQHVTSLNLSSNQLSGTIPRELGQLTALNSLMLAGNQLRGCLPQNLTDLHALQSFHFDTDLLRVQDNAVFAAWLAGIPDKSPGPWATCWNCYFPVWR